MSSEPVHLPPEPELVPLSDPDLRRLMGVGAVRLHSDTLHAWVAKRGHVNDGGIVFPPRAYESPKFAAGAPLLIGDERVGRVYGVAMASDGHLVTLCTIKNPPDWLRGETLAYSMAEFSADWARCPICRSVLRRGLTPCECVWGAPSIVFSNICVEAVRIMPVRRDDYIEGYRRRALSRFLAEVAPNAAPGFMNDEPRAAIPEDSPGAELPEPPGYGGAL